MSSNARLWIAGVEVPIEGWTLTEDGSKVKQLEPGVCKPFTVSPVLNIEWSRATLSSEMRFLVDAYRKILANPNPTYVRVLGTKRNRIVEREIMQRRRLDRRYKIPRRLFEYLWQWAQMKGGGSERAD